MFCSRSVLRKNSSFINLFRLLSNKSEQNSSFSFLPTNNLPVKLNRKKGLTEIRGPYYAPVTKTYLDELLFDWGDYVDGIK